MDRSRKTKHAFVCHISLWRKSFWKMLSYEAWELFPLDAVWKKASCMWSTASIHDNVLVVAGFLCCSLSFVLFSLIENMVMLHGEIPVKSSSRICLLQTIMTSILPHAQRTLWNILVVKLWDWTRGHGAADSTLDQMKQDWWCFHSRCNKWFNGERGKERDPH